MSTRSRLAVVMDPIAAIKYAKDTTLAMLLAAQARGFELHYLEQARPAACATAWPTGACARLTVRADPEDWFTLGEAQTEPLGELDVHPDAQGSALRHRVHLHHLHPRAGRAGGRAGGQPAAGPARHEREGLHRLVPAVLRADADHARHGRHGRLPARARPDRRKPLRRHGRALDLRGRAGRQERARGLRDPDRLRAALRHRAALPAGDRRLPATRGCC